MVVGAENDPETLPLYRVSTALLLPDARVVVVNAGTNELFFFGRGGEHLRTVGREGQGPGEFTWPRWADTLPDGRIVVWDGPAFRTHVFSPTGEFIRTTRLEHSVPAALRTVAEFPGVPHVVGLFGDGSLLIKPSYPTSYVTSRVDGNHLLPSALIRYSASGTPIARVTIAAGDEHAVFRGSSMPLPFGRRALVAANGDRVFVGSGVNEYRVDVFDANGQHLRAMTRPADLHEVDPADVRLLTARFLSRVVERNRAAAAEELEALELPKHFPVYDALLADAEGNLWVRDFDWPRDDEPQLWTVFSPQGAWLGSVVTPGGLNLTDISADHIVGVVSDDLGVETVRVHRISKPSGF